MSFPSNLFFTEDHEWVSGLSGTVKVGISSYAIEQLGDIVHIDLPAVGKQFDAKEPFGTVESTKTVSDLYMPAKAKIVEVNSALLKSPETLQADPYNAGWLVKVAFESEASDLMKASQYESYIKESN